jgi:hypothetical protein
MLERRKTLRALGYGRKSLAKILQTGFGQMGWKYDIMER